MQLMRRVRLNHDVHESTCYNSVALSRFSFNTQIPTKTQLKPVTVNTITRLVSPQRYSGGEGAGLMLIRLRAPEGKSCFSAERRQKSAAHREKQELLGGFGVSWPFNFWKNLLL